MGGTHSEVDLVFSKRRKVPRPSAPGAGEPFAFTKGHVSSRMRPPRARYSPNQFQWSFILVIHCKGKANTLWLSPFKTWFTCFLSYSRFSIGSLRSSFSKREHVPRPSAPGAKEPVVFLKKASRGSYTEGL